MDLETPSTAVDPTVLAGRLRLSVTRLARLLRNQDDSGLSATLGAALATIAHSGPLTLGELAATEQVSPPSITKVVDKLEQRGLVSRRSDETDGRVCRVQLTAAGRRQFEGMRRRRTAWLATRLGELDPADLERLHAAADLLERLSAPTERSPQ